MKSCSGANRRMGRRGSSVSNSRADFGFTLIELMIAMLLGLLVVGGVVSVFLATQQTYRANQGLGDVQDSSRIAFDMMARDIREAGLTGCYSTGSVGNVLNNGPNGPNAAGATWWANWANVIHGYDSGDPATSGLTAAPQLAGTSSLQLIGASNSSISVKTYNPTASTFQINETGTTIQAGDVVVVCDPNHAVITSVSAYAAGPPITLTHAVSSAASGNCSTGLAFPTVCTPAGTSYPYGPNSQIAKLSAVDWYIGTNSVGGQSLYRIDLETVAGVPTPTSEEMVRDVTKMTIAYHQLPNATFLPAASITSWAAVDSVQVTLTVLSSNKLAGTNMTPIQRVFTSTSTLRNRVN
jgi:type IV pilus assembly protein PilW